MTSRRALLTLLIAAASLATTRSLNAQSLGTLRWQLQPYCNVLTVTVVQDGGQYHVDGTDDLCGAARKASVVGLAFPNPDGSIGFGLTTVTAPGGTPIHIDATISVASASGTWRDSAGSTGSFAFTPGAGGGGSPRPIPAGGIAPGSITAAQLAPGAVAAAVAGFGMCPAGQYLRGTTAAGAVVCEPFAAPPRLSVGDAVAGSGQYSALKIGADGLPVMGHRGSASSALLVTHCGNAACSTNNVSTTVDDPANLVGTYISVAIGADGLPIISHLDSSAQALRITHCGNVACTAGNVSTLADDPADAVGAHTSIAIGSDGLPIVSHENATAGVLRVTHCGTVTCASGNTSTNADHLAGSGTHSSITIGADGLPLISHLDFGQQALRVTHCGNVACTVGTVSTTVDHPADSVGTFTSVAIGSDGLPVVSHLNASARALRITHCGNAACTVATSVDADLPPVVTSGPVYAFGTMTSIAIGTDGLPVVSQAERFGAASALRVLHCGNAGCTAGNAATTVDSATGVGLYSSVAIGADGLPIISHYDSATTTLKVAKCGSRTCQ